MRNRQTARHLSWLTCLLALGLVACGGSPTASQGSEGTSQVEKHAVEVYQRLNGLSGQERKSELVKLAEEEGALSIYTSNTDIDALIEDAGFSLLTLDRGYTTGPKPMAYLYKGVALAPQS